MWDSYSVTAVSLDSPHGSLRTTLRSRCMLQCDAAGGGAHLSPEVEGLL